MKIGKYGFLVACAALVLTGCSPEELELDIPTSAIQGVKGSDTSVYVLLYMLDRGESEVTGSAAVCAADCVADLVYYAAEGERLWDL